MMLLVQELTIVLSFHRKASNSSKGRPLNTMAFRRAERLPRSSASTNRLPVHEARPVLSPSGFTLRSSGSRRSSTHENLDATACTSRPVLDGRTLFNDPVNVQQWVVTTSTGSTLPADHSYSSCDIGQRGVTYDETSTTGSFLPGGAIASHFPLSSEIPRTGFPNPGEMSNDLQCVTHDLTNSAFYPLDFDFNDDFSANAVLPCDSWTGVDSGSYSVPGPTDMMYTTSADSHRFVDAEYQASPSRSNSDAYLPGADLLHSDYDGCVIDPSLWCTPDSAIMDPSVSSFSQGNFFPQLAGSPSSFSTQEELQSLDTVEEFGFSPLSVDGPSISYTSSSLDEQYDPARFVPITIASLPSSNVYFSTIKAVQAFQRPALSNLVAWPTCDSMVCPSVMSTYGDARIPRRMSNESEHIPARHNELYQIGPMEDGLYHCPFETKDGCTHKPEKLKCNYE